VKSRPLDFLALVLAGLGLGPGLAHLLELSVKLTYPPELYAAVTSTLYGFFGSVGAVVQVGAVAVNAEWASLGEPEGGRRK
jgi:hypothetical protein